MMSTAKVLIEGRNFVILLERLKRQKVHVLNIRKISETQTIITVKYKDLKKVFAISQNMWYNTLLGLGGFVGFLSKIKKSALAIIFSAVFLASCYLLDGCILDVDVYGVSGDRLAEVYRIVSDCGVKRGKANLGLDTEYIRKSLFKNFSDCDFVTVKKSGNRLIIDIICNTESPKPIEISDKVCAKRSGKITSLKVYSGTACKSVGDYCNKSEVLAEGYYLDKSGQRVEINCLIGYTLECVYEKEYVVDSNATTDRLIAKALFDGEIDELTVKDLQVTPVLEGENSKTYLVKITYIYQE